MTTVQQTTAEVIARAITQRADRGAFGVLLFDAPDFAPEALIRHLRAPRGRRATLRLAMPGYAAGMAKALREGAREAGFTDDMFVTTVEGAERWRNDPAVRETIVVVAPRELPKLHSLNRFETISGAEIFRLVCEIAEAEVSANEPLRQFWSSLRRSELRRALPLDGLLAYFHALRAVPRRDLPTRSRELLHLLGLLPDPEVFVSLPPAKIARRLLENARVVDQLEVLSRSDRQRIARALAATPGKASPRLQETFQQVMAFHRDQDPARLRGLTLPDVQALLRARDDRAETPAAPSEEPTPERPTAIRPAVMVADLILQGDNEGLAELADVLDGALQDGDTEVSDPRTGAQIDAVARHPLQRLIERCVDAERWGALVRTDAPTFEEAARQLDRAEVNVFGPVSEAWAVRDTLRDLVESGLLPRAVLKAFDAMCDARRTLASGLRLLLVHPEVQVNRSLEYRAEAERYLAAYYEVVEAIKQGYQAVAEVAPEGVDILCSQLLALDTIVLRTPGGWKALLSPLHPLHLWKYVELSRQLRLQAGALTEAEARLLRSRVAELPSLVTTVHLSGYITLGDARVLPETGASEGLPYFEEGSRRHVGRDGLVESVAVLERFCALHPHARLGLRVALVDPPEVELLLKALVRLRARPDAEIDAIHVRLFFTRGDRCTAAMGGGAEDEEGAEAFRGAGSAAPFTLEVREGVALGAIADELRAQPAHVAMLFDLSAVRPLRFPRSPSPPLSPLCVPSQFIYDRITKSVRVVPAADEGIYAVHNDLRNRLSHQVANSFFGVTAEAATDRQDLRRVAEGCAWLIVCDQPQESSPEVGAHRVALQRCGRRDVSVYAASLERFVEQIDRQLRRLNYAPSAEALRRVVIDLNSLRADGLLSLALRGVTTAEEKRLQAAVSAVAMLAWYREIHPRSLAVSLDAEDVCAWLELPADADRVDLLGIEDSGDTLTVDLIAGYRARDKQPWQSEGGEATGPAIRSLVRAGELLEEVFDPASARERILAPQRREVLRRRLFFECFFDGRTEADRQGWIQRLNDLFAGRVRATVRLTLAPIGLTRPSAAAPRRLKAAGRSIAVNEIAEDTVRRYLSEAPSSAPSPEPQARRDEAAASDAAQGTAKDYASPNASSSGASADPVPPAPSAASHGESYDERSLIERQAGELRRVLRDHGIPVQELDASKVQVGPSVIRYRVRLRAGAKVSALRSRAEDIGRELAARTTPFIDNVSGEHYVAIDLERPVRAVVDLLPVIDRLPRRRALELLVAAGVTPSGEPVTLDLVQLPHLLVAGSTMSGKTVFLHAIVLSLLLRLGPESLELAIIDPKATDFVAYNGLPHIHGGRVITEADDALAYLRRLADHELRERTEVLQDAQCPNLSEYNATNPKQALRPIVVLVDEYADLVAVQSKRERTEFEREISRLAQRARSVGIHLVLATQRPTTDVITGLLKANMPCRVSFRLPQRIDSQTILDRSGAENLFGAGDMLLLRDDRLVRLQGYLATATDVSRALRARYPGAGIITPVSPAPEIRAEDIQVDDSSPANRKDLVGEVTALAAGAAGSDMLGGAVLTIEAGAKPGENEEVICRAGEVMRKSVRTAWRYVQSHAAELGIPEERLRGTGVSVHVVNIAEPREGPSAGIGFVTAIVSALTGRPVRAGIAMSGEVSLKGKIIRVGGIVQKVVAAYRNGRRMVILPRANEADLIEVPAAIRSRLDIRLVEVASEAVELALV